MDEEEMPQSQCPYCKWWQDDPDGFGVQKCDHCGHCRHPCETEVNGRWVCDLCGRESNR